MVVTLATKQQAKEKTSSAFIASFFYTTCTTFTRVYFNFSVNFPTLSSTWLNSLHYITSPLSLNGLTLRYVHIQPLHVHVLEEGP